MLMALAALAVIYMVYVNKDVMLGTDNVGLKHGEVQQAKSEVLLKKKLAESVDSPIADWEMDATELDAKGQLRVSGVRAHIIDIKKVHDTEVFPGSDEQHMHGKIGVRLDGTTGWAATPLVGEETMEQKRLHHKGNCFNLARSDSLPLDHTVPDVRSPRCPKSYSGYLPNTSVIFVFFNEPASPLYRSIHSVLDRSPPDLLHEIILVDDGSDAEWLKKPLEDYIALLPKVRLVRMEKRLGLMATRVMGAKVATGETVTFLDAHIEVNHGWLEPLMARIGEDRHHVVMPIIDSIDADSFDYRSGGLDILAFSWSLGQKGVSRPRKDVEPMPSPISERVG